MQFSSLLEAATKLELAKCRRHGFESLEIQEIYFLQALEGGLICLRIVRVVIASTPALNRLVLFAPTA